MHLGEILLSTNVLVLLVAFFSIFRGGVSNFSKSLLGLHLGIVVVVIGLLYSYIFGDRFEYFYVWNHSAASMPIEFKISCLWEGQEGSFLLWIFWNTLLMVVLAWSKKEVMNKSLLYFIPIQLVLLSMVLGWEIPAWDFELGSSPFVLLKDKIQSEVYDINPDFVPLDGTGMNALLQNYWMVIHPPVIFLGFAVSAVPFVICCAAFSKSYHSNWVQLAMPWVLFSILTVGTGMLMGAYWAYVTLNFGGFWNWDPVENAIYIPWLVMIVVMHLMVIYRKNQHVLAPLTVLTLSSFVLIIYSTFLTRSGILGESSVHAFTDLGLSGQLLVFLILFVFTSIIVFCRALKFFPKKEISETVSPKQFEFWLYIGVLVIGFAAFQVLLPTSFPVFNAIGDMIGHPLFLATPVDQVGFYTKFQHWFALAAVLLLVVTQYFYWRNRLPSKVIEFAFIPACLGSLLSVGYLIYFSPDNYLLMLSGIVLIFGVVFNIHFLTIQGGAKNLGGRLSHVGFTIMIFGILISHGYKKNITVADQFGGKLNSAGNVLLVQDKDVQLGEYGMSFKNSFYKTLDGELIDVRGFGDAFNPKNLIIKKEQTIGGVVYQKGDELEIDKNNVYHQVEFSHQGASFTIFPRVQFNDKMGVIPSPDLVHLWSGDLYTHISNFPDTKKKRDFSESSRVTLKKGEKWIIGDRVLELKDVEVLEASTDSVLLLQSVLAYSSADTSIELKPVLLKGPQTRVITASVEEDEFQLVFDGIGENESFSFSYLTAPMHWITISTTYFPFVYVFWFGGVLLLLGVSYSIMSKFSFSFMPSMGTIPVRKMKTLGIRKVMLNIINNDND